MPAEESAKALIPKDRLVDQGWRETAPARDRLALIRRLLPECPSLGPARGRECKGGGASTGSNALRKFCEKSKGIDVNTPPPKGGGFGVTAQSGIGPPSADMVPT